MRVSISRCYNQQARSSDIACSVLWRAHVLVLVPFVDYMLCLLCRFLVAWPSAGSLFCGHVSPCSRNACTHRSL